MASPPTKIKRSSSEYFEAPPTKKRINIPGDLTPDRGEDRGNLSTSGRKLVPVIPRVQASVFKNYQPVPDSTGDIEAKDEDSDDEFVDAEEGVDDGDWGEAMSNLTPGPIGGGSGFFKTEPQTSPTKKLKEDKKIELSEIFEDMEQDEQAKREDMGDVRTKHYAQLKSQKEGPQVQKIKPETISIDSDSEDEGDLAAGKTHGKTFDAEDEEEDMSGTDTSDRKGDKVTISNKDDDNVFEDLFESTFPKGAPVKTKAEAETNAAIKQSIEISSHTTTSGFSSKSHSKTFPSGIHSTKIRSPSTNTPGDPATPPSDQPRTTPPSSHHSAGLPTAPTNPNPDTLRDTSPSIRRHAKFHSRAQNLIPRLPNYETYEWNRRYWIAVLLLGKNPFKTTLSEKDFVWMKGNRFSTVSTVFHSYAVTTMADPEDLGLVIGDEGVRMEDQMRELDYFGDRLVVFRAVRVRGNEREVEGGSLVRGVVTREAVVELDLD